jgi:hypothetical protein
MNDNELAAGMQTMAVDQFEVALKGHDFIAC